MDYARDDFSRDRGHYDVLFDTVGKSGIRRGVAALRHGGVYAFASPDLPAYALLSLRALLTRRVRVIGGMARGSADALRFLLRLVEEGRFTPVIDRTFPLSEIVEAHRYVDAGHKKGNVVIVLRETCEDR